MSSKLKMMSFAACAAALLTVSAQANPLDSGVRVYRIEAYVDQAPAGAAVSEVVRIGRSEEGRTLYIVTAVAGAPENAGRAFREEAASDLSLNVAGTKENVSSLLGAKKGEKVSGTFVYRPAQRTLFVQQLDS